ncbi:MAG: MFS transporter [Steroidobacteraceae bacterium]
MAGGSASRAQALGWALGALSTSVLINSAGLLQLRFMTDSLGIGAALAGTLLAISRIYDGIADPLMGLVTDRTHSRWGRRRPWLLLGALMCGIALAALFNVPRIADARLLAGYMLLVLLYFATAYTVFRIPYLALGADLARSFDARSRLMSFNVYGSSVGSLLATTGAPFLLAAAGGGRDAHGLMALLLGCLVLASGLASFALTAGAPEADALQHRHYGWRERLAALRQNRPFLALILTKVLLFIGLGLHMSSIAFFVKHVLRLTDFSLGTVFLMQTLTTILSQPLWVRIASRLGRRNALLVAIGFDLCLMACWWALPAGGSGRWLVPLGLLQGVATGGLILNIQCMLPDTMDHDEQRFGLRRQGLFAGIFVMVEKFTSAFAMAIFGGFIDAMGYVAAADSAALQPSSALLAIRASVSVLPAAFMLLAAIALTTYHLPGDRR